MLNSEIYELLRKIVEESREFADSRSVFHENEEAKTISKLWNEYKEYVNGINKCGRLAVLIPALTEAYFKKMLPMLAIPAKELLEGDDHRMNDIRSLQQGLKEDDVKDVWKQMAESFHYIIKSLGLTVDSDIYADILSNVHILISAFSYLENFDFSGSNKYRQIYQARAGKASDKQPVFINTVTIFRNIYDIVSTVERSNLDSLIMFAAVRMTYGDTNDYLSDWISGDNARKRNTMRNEHISEEEYKNTIDEWTRMVYLVVKNGQNIWLVPSSCGSSLRISESFYEYGKRNTYFPYQILFREFNGAPEHTTMLATPNTSYRLNNVIDEEQKVFIPILMYEAKRKFFDEEIPIMEQIIIPQETKLLFSSVDESVLNALTESNAIQAIHVYQSTNYSPIELFNDATEVLAMIQLLNISEDDIKTAPILPTQEKLRQGEFEECLHKNVVRAYRAVIDRRLKELRDTEKETQEFYHMECKAFTERRDVLEEMLAAGRFINYSSEYIDNLYGATSRYQNVHQGYRERNTYANRTNFVICPDGYLDMDKKYPVCIEVRPYTKKEIMEFYGWTDDTELPFLIKHRDEVLAYYGAKKGNVLRDSDYEGIIHVRGMNACMGKKFYNKYLAPLFDTKMYYEIAFTDKQSEWRKEFVQQLEERGYSVSQKYQMNSDFRVIAVKEE